MSQTVKRRGGTTAQHATFTGAEREITVDTDKHTIVVHDGTTAGGYPLARESALGDLQTAIDGASNQASAIESYVLARKFSGCAAYRTTNTGNILTNADLTAVPFETVAFDFDNWWDISGPTAFYVPNLPGLIGVRLAASFAFLSGQNGGTQGEVRFRKNGSAAFPGAVFEVKPSTRFFHLATGVVPAAAGDIFGLEVYHNFGSAAGVAASGTNFSIEAVFGPE